jgi:hypothetical protein
MTVEIVEVFDLGDDSLEIVYTDGEVSSEGDLLQKQVYGWKSAIEATPVDDTRDESGHRIDDSRRRMTTEEARAYILSLVPQGQPPQKQPYDVGFGGGA